MKLMKHGLILSLTLVWPLMVAARGQSYSSTPNGSSGNMQAASEQIVAMANQARAQAGVGRLQWDPALAAAALQHCLRMAAEGPIAHRYGGEADVTGRLVR